MNSHRVIALAGLSIAMATALGAFGTHALKPVLTEARFDSFEIGVSYQFFHSLGLLGVGLMHRQFPQSAALAWTIRILVFGMLLFCGSIYALTFGAPRLLGMVAPFGGASLMLAWVVFALGVLRLRPTTP
jgi:uncharacterized membrane protein YgdD (TMEM256/DUF423 family)